MGEGEPVPNSLRDEESYQVNELSSSQVGYKVI